MFDWLSIGCCYRFIVAILVGGLILGCSCSVVVVVGGGDDGGGRESCLFAYFELFLAIFDNGVS